MFKSILTSRRIPDAEFQIVAGPVETASNGKENYPGLPALGDIHKIARPDKSKKRKGKEQPPVDGYMTSQAFDQLLDELQVPDNMRGKLATMAPNVKAAFLKSSKDMAITVKPSNPPLTPRTLRRAHSIESISSPCPQGKRDYDDLSRAALPRPAFLGTHGRGVSFDAKKAALPYGIEPLFVPKQTKEKSAKEKVKKEKGGKSAGVTPAKWCTILKSVSTVQLEVETAKKLRLLLRNEPTSWTQEFLDNGGYDALLTRLNEILHVEWREEQHDDQILHELLRCFKALSTSAIGCAALRSACPAPYDELIVLLYSDKRPGDVGTRQLIVELLLILFELYPPSSLPSTGSPSQGHTRTSSTPWDGGSRSPVSSGLVTLPVPHATLFAFVRSLLLTPAPPPAEETGPNVELHPFIEDLHKPRRYRTYLEELSNVCRDYFWVFCHPSNTIWNLDETDEGKVEKPRAPGGMTGGVEFEAMTYMTMHFKFLNALAKSVEDLHLPSTHEHSAYQFHNDLFLSGLERIIAMGRKASTAYYPTLHLEIARYVTAASRAGFELPWSIVRLIGPPPSAMRKHVSKPSSRSHTPSNTSRNVSRGSASVPSSPTKRAAASAPGLPGPRKVTPAFAL